MTVKKGSAYDLCMDLGMNIEKWTPKQKGLFNRLSAMLAKQEHGIQAGDVLINEGIAYSVAGVDHNSRSVFVTSCQPTYDDNGKQCGSTMDYTTLAAYSINQCFPVKGKKGWWFWRFK
jgi:hypothetical protein